MTGRQVKIYISTILILSMPMTVAQDVPAVPGTLPLNETVGDVVERVEVAEPSQATQPSLAELTLESAVATAISNHPQLQSGAAGVRQQNHLVYQVTRRPNPVVGYTASEVGNEGQAGQQGVFVSQDFVRGNKLHFNGQVQRREVGIAAEQLRLLQLQIDADVSLAFIETAVAQERSKLLQRLQQPLDRAAGAARRLVDSGELSLSAALQSRLEAERNRMQIARTKTELQYASQSLAAILGWSQLEGSVSEDALKPAADVRSADDCLVALYSQSPELSIAQCRYAVAKWQVRREEVEPIPDMQTQLSLQQDASTHHTVVGIQLGFELPVHDANRGAINAARADTWKKHYAIEAIRRSLKQRLVQVVSQRDQAQQQLQTINEELESLARDNLQTTQRAFALGEATYLDLLNAQRAYIRLNLDTLSLYRQLAIANTHLRTLLVRTSVADGQ